MIKYNDQVLFIALALIWVSSIGFQETFYTWNVYSLSNSAEPVPKSYFAETKGKSNWLFKQLHKSVPIGNKTKINKIHTYKWLCN